MVGMIVKKKGQSPPHWWWLDNQQYKSSSIRSTWLQSTLAELDYNTEAMRKLIEADADSFAQRAEMYYKKRPELISMVEEFYRAHRSLAEKYDQVKSESGTRVLTTLCSPFSVTKYHLEKSPSRTTFQTDDSFSETCESEVDDPEEEEEEEEEEECSTPISTGIGLEEVRKMKEEIERLREENRVQKEELSEKDEEKREVIRQLSLAVDLLKEENVKLKKSVVAKESPEKKGSFEFNKLKDGLFGKLFNGYQNYPVVAL